MTAAQSRSEGNQFRIAWLAVARAPYNDNLFSELGKHFKLEVYLKFKEQSSHPWDLGVSHYISLPIDRNFAKCFLAIRRADLVVVTGWNIWKYLVLALAIPQHSVSVFWTDTPDLRKKKGVLAVIRRLVIKFVFWRCDLIWSTGKTGCEALRRLGCPTNKIGSFPFFVPIPKLLFPTDAIRDSALSFRQKNERGSQCVFLGMGRLVPSKRFADPIKALPKIANNVVLWIAGIGSELEYLRCLAEDLGVSERVVFLGWLQPAEALQALSTCDVFVHPAEHDPFPTVVLDAMAWGKPVIGTSSSGSVIDRVTDGESGFIYDAGDVDRLANFMSYFADNPKIAKKFGQNARVTASKYPVDIAVDIIRAAASEIGVNKHSVRMWRWIVSHVSGKGRASDFC